MTRDKFIKKGKLVKANRDMWGYFFDPRSGNLNIEIKKNTVFVVLSDELCIGQGNAINGLIDNKIVTIGIKEEFQFEVLD